MIPGVIPFKNAFPGISEFLLVGKPKKYRRDSVLTMRYERPVVVMVVMMRRKGK